MDSLAMWEEIRILAYIFTVLGVVLFLIGVYFDAASFGLGADSPSVVTLIGSVVKDTGTVCGVVGGGLGFLTEGLK